MKVFGVVMIAVMALVLAACGKDENNTSGPGNQPPVMERVELIPRDAKQGTSIILMLKGMDREGDSMDFEHEWYINDKKQDSLVDKKLDTDDLNQGDRILVMARAVEKSTGRKSDWVKSNTVALGLPPAPVAESVELEPFPTYSFTPITAVADFGEADIDDYDEVYYKWFVNNQPVGEDDELGEELPDSYFNRNDKVYVQVSLEPGFPPSSTKSSPVSTISNAPPQVVSEPEIVIGANGVAKIFVSLEDPDGDPIRFTLSKAPPGSSIDPQTGTITVDTNKLAPGVYPIEYSAADPHGGGYNFQVNFEK